jgi:hypothetical protein
MVEPQTDFSVRMASFVNGLPTEESVLIPLYEAYRAAYAALISVHNQPRVQGLAADIIESESVRVIDFACVVAVKLSQLASITDRWREPYIETMVSHVFFVGGNARDAQNALMAARALPVAGETSSRNQIGGGRPKLPLTILSLPPMTSRRAA